MRVNNAIRAHVVRLIDAEGKQVGVLDTKEALRQSRLVGLDLVEISPATRPPVCKIMDFGKFQYEQAKKEREQKKGKKKTDIKGIRIGFKTGDHDQELKRKHTEDFLMDGDKVRVEIVLRGREKAHKALARTIIEAFLRKIAVPHKQEESIAPHPNGFSVTLAPIANKEQTKTENPVTSASN